MGVRPSKKFRGTVGLSKNKPKKTWARVNYVFVRKYATLEGTKKLRWLDTYQLGSSILPAPLLYEMLVQRFCYQRNIHHECLRLLSMMVYLETTTGEQFNTMVDFENLGLMGRKLLHECMGWLVHYSMVQKMTRKRGTSYFLTLNGQSCLNEFYMFCLEEDEKIRANIANWTANEPKTP